VALLADDGTLQLSRLPSLSRKGAHPAAGGALADAVVPHRLRGDGASGVVGDQPRPTAGQGVRAGRGEVDVALVVGGAVGAAVVTDGDRDAERGGVSQRLVERDTRLHRPRVLALSPADAQRGGRRGGVRGPR
jgi:hypothetical protein